MKTDPELKIFRRFDYLHLREILYLQEELTMLEGQLNKIDRAESIAINNMSRQQDNNEERKKLMSQIRVLLIKYGAVIQTLIF